MKPPLNYRYITVILYVLIFTGVFFSLINLFYNRSIWFDEALLSLNIIDKPFSKLFAPLDMNQVAPIGFLLVQKLIANIFSEYDWSLRIIPFISYLVSIPLFYKINRKLHFSKLFSLFACALLCMNTTFISYSIEVKQYVLDVLFALVIINSYLNISNNNKNSILTYSIIGIFAVWFSSISIIILLITSLLILYKNYKSVSNTKLFTGQFTWILSFIIYYILFIHNHPSKDYMITYWTNSNGFLPTHSFNANILHFIYDKIQMVFAELLGYSKLWYTITIFYIIGVLQLLKRKKLLFILIGPLIIHLVMSGLKLYPFQVRMILYTLPLILIVITLGIFTMYRYVKKEFASVPLFLIIIPVAVQIYPLTKRIPMFKEEIKKSIEFVNENMVNNDKVYVYYSSVPAFNFYSKFYPGVKNKFMKVIGKENNENNWSHLDQDLKEIRPNSWLIFSHVHPFSDTLYKEENYIIDRLKYQGLKIEINKKYHGSSVYKLSD